MKAYQIALTEYGLQETPGAASNREIEKYFSECGYNFKDDTAWCAAFMNYCQERAGNTSTGKLNAKSYLRWGKKVDEPLLGDVVVLHRGGPKSWKGHVGFFIAKRYGYVFVLGGNQSNRVKISAYPVSRVAGYRYF